MRPKSTTMNTRGRKKTRESVLVDLSYNDAPKFGDRAKGLSFGAPKQSMKNFKTIAQDDDDDEVVYNSNKL